MANTTMLPSSSLSFSSKHTSLLRGVSALLLVAVFLSQCNKTEPGQQAASVPEPTAKEEGSNWKTWVAKGTDPEWLKKQWEDNRGAITQKAQGALQAIEKQDLQKLVADLQLAFENQDMAKIEELAKSIDEKMVTKGMSDAIHFIMIHRRQGGDAAVKAIDDYAARRDLTEFEKAAAQRLKNSMAFIQRDDVRGWVAVAIMYACQCKFGSHEGALIGCGITMFLFPDFDPAKYEKPSPP